MSDCCQKIYNSFALTVKEGRKRFTFLHVSKAHTNKNYIFSDNIHTLLYIVNISRIFNCDGCLSVKVLFIFNLISTLIFIHILSTFYVLILQNRSIKHFTCWNQHSDWVLFRVRVYVPISYSKVFLW